MTFLISTLYHLESGAQFHLFHGMITQCQQGTHKEAGLCQSNTRTCTVTNGSGTQNWNGASYGTCTATSCNLGYYKNGNTCDPLRKCRGSVYAATYTEAMHGVDDVSHVFVSQSSLSSGYLSLAGKDHVIKYWWTNNNNGVTTTNYGTIPVGLNWTTGYGASGGNPKTMYLEVYDRAEYFSNTVCNNVPNWGTICTDSPAYGYNWVWWDGSQRAGVSGALKKGSFLRYDYSYISPSSSCDANHPTDMGLSSGAQ